MVKLIHGDTSLITNMSNLFVGKSSFNDDISNWDVSNVTNMYAMFQGASSFNQPLDSWNVSNVRNMNSIYGHHSIKASWIVSNVNDMSYMFMKHHSINQLIHGIVCLKTCSKLFIQSTTQFMECFISD